LKGNRLGFALAATLLAPPLMAAQSIEAGL
jgi:hypothetical protein